MGGNQGKEREQTAPFCCINCPYGRHREICFPCYKDLLGQEGVKVWETKKKNKKEERV